MDEIATKLIESSCPELLKQFPNDCLGAEDLRGLVAVVIRPEKIREMIQFLKNDPTLSFDVMMDLFAIDYSKFIEERPERFAVVYNLASLGTKRRIFLKAYLPEAKPEIDSIFDLYKAANWFEREAWDLFGVVFRNHPNLIRILCHNDFVGYPLRKDYPSDQYQRLKNAAPSTGI